MPSFDRNYTRKVHERRMAYEGIANRVYQEMRVPYGLQQVFKAQIHAESSWNPAAVSPAGATGLTQFMPATARRFGVQYGTSPEAVRTQVRGQVLYMNYLIKRYNGNVTQAAMAYNMGEGGMDRVLQGKRQAPAETKAYPIRIQTYMNYYR